MREHSTNNELAPSSLGANPPNPKQQYGDIKPNLALIPGSSLVYLALALGEGGRKYGPFNWRYDPVEAQTYIAACERHLRAWHDREETDSDSGNPHLAHAAACLAILIDAQACGTLIDNRPPPGPTGELLRTFTAARAARTEAAQCQPSPSTERRSTRALPFWRRITETLQARLARSVLRAPRYNIPSTSRSD